MLKSELDELHNMLVPMCPDHAGVDVTHLGRFRVKVVAVTKDAKTTTLALCLEEDEFPKDWAKRIARQLHQGFIA